MSSSEQPSTSKETKSQDIPGEDPSVRGKNHICPSKSSVYIGNISYSLTNNDLIKLLEHFGRVVSAKIVKDPPTRKSKGYGFVQFLQVEAAQRCVQEFNGAYVFGRKWSCSIAKDNGRTEEFIRKRTYPDKSRCYECGEFGHLSYKCPRNALGEREPPRKIKKGQHHSKNFTENRLGSSQSQAIRDAPLLGESESESENELETLSAAINFERALAEEESYRESVASGNYQTCVNSNSGVISKPKFVKSDYFSDEENLVEDDD